MADQDLEERLLAHLPEGEVPSLQHYIAER
jgi:hypothetical protein